MTKNNKQQTSNFILSEEYRKINIGFFWRGFLKNIPVRRRRPGLREGESISTADVAAMMRPARIAGGGKAFFFEESCTVPYRLRGEQDVFLQAIEAR